MATKKIPAYNPELDSGKTDHFSEQAKKLFQDKVLVNQLYKLQKEHYIENTEFDEIFEATKKVATFLNTNDKNGNHSSDIVLDKIIKNLKVIDFTEQLRSMQNTTISKKGNVSKGRAPVNADNMNEVIKEMSDMINKIAIVSNHYSSSNILTGFSAQLTKSLLMASAAINNSAFNTLDDILDKFLGQVTNFMSALVENLVNEYIDTTFIPNQIDKLFLSSATIGTDILENAGVKYSKNSSEPFPVPATQVRDITITGNGKKDSFNFNLGISVKNYVLENKAKDTATVKLRTSTFASVLSRLVGQIQVPTSGFTSLLKSNNVAQGAVGAFHSFGNKAAIHNRIGNINTIMEYLKQIIGMIMFDQMLSQTDFKTQGIQLIFLTNKFLNWKQIFPEDPKSLAVRGIEEDKVERVHSSKSMPSFSNHVDTMEYLMRYLSLKDLELHYRMKINTMMKQYG